MLFQLFFFLVEKINIVYENRRTNKKIPIIRKRHPDLYKAWTGAAVQMCSSSSLA